MSPSCASHFMRVVTRSSDEVTFAVGTVEGVFLHQVQVGKVHRCQGIEKVVVVSTDVNDFGPAVLHHLHENLEEAGMCGLPAARPVLADVPAVDDVAVEEEPFAVDAAQETADLLDFGVGSSQVNVREDNGAVMSA